MPISNVEHVYRLVTHDLADEADAFIDNLPRHVALYVVGTLMSRFMAEYMEVNSQATSALTAGDKERYAMLRDEAKQAIAWMGILENMVCKDITPEEE